MVVITWIQVVQAAWYILILILIDHRRNNALDNRRCPNDIHTRRYAFHI